MSTLSICEKLQLGDRHKLVALCFAICMSLYFAHYVGYQQRQPLIQGSKWTTAEYDRESFWFDLIVKKNICILEKLPSDILRYDGHFWRQQLQQINETTTDKGIETLSAIMQDHLEKRLENEDCSQKLTLSCGLSNKGCGLGCQLHHTAFCAMISFTLGIPLIQDLSDWPFESPWETYFKRMGSKCSVNKKTVFVIFPSYHPRLRFNELCGENTCVSNSTIELSLHQDIPITTELLNLLSKFDHKNPFLWYVGQFVRYSLRLNREIAALLEMLDKNLEFGRNPPVVGIQARRTDKIRESKDSYHNESEYMEIAGKQLERYGSPKTVYVASEDHTILPTIRKRYGLPEWKILGFESNVTLYGPGERKSDLGLLSIVRDVYFLGKSDYLICGLSSNVCRLILEVMATRLHDADSRCYSVDGDYSWLIYGDRYLNLVPV